MENEKSVEMDGAMTRKAIETIRENVTVPGIQPSEACVIHFTDEQVAVLDSLMTGKHDRLMAFIDPCVDGEASKPRIGSLAAASGKCRVLFDETHLWGLEENAIQKASATSVVVDTFIAEVAANISKETGIPVEDLLRPMDGATP